MRFEELFPEAISQRRILALIEARMNSGIRPLFGEIPEPYRLRFVSAKILSTVDFHHAFGMLEFGFPQKRAVTDPILQ